MLFNIIDNPDNIPKILSYLYKIPLYNILKWENDIKYTEFVFKPEFDTFKSFPNFVSNSIKNFNQFPKFLILDKLAKSDKIDVWTILNDSDIKSAFSGNYEMLRNEVIFRKYGNNYDLAQIDKVWFDSEANYIEEYNKWIEFRTEFIETKEVDENEVEDDNEYINSIVISSIQKQHILKKIDDGTISGLDLFLQIEPNDNIQYIQFMDYTSNHCKREYFNPEPKLLIETFAKAFNKARNKIVNEHTEAGLTPYIKLFPSSEIPSIEYLSKLGYNQLLLNFKSYQTVILTPSINQYTLSISNDIINSELLKQLGSDKYEIKESSMEKISGEIAISSAINPIVFYSLSIIHPFFRKYFSINELQFTFSEKIRNINFIFSFEENKLIFNINEEKRVIVFKDASNNLFISKFVIILNHCIQIINSDDWGNYYKLLNTNIPNCIKNIQETKKNGVTSEGVVTKYPKTLKTKIKNLTAHSNGMTGPEYNSDCQCNRQPIIIHIEEQHLWLPRQAVVFNNRAYICPTIDNPNCGITISKKKGGKEFVCCFSKRKQQTKEEKDEEDIPATPSRIRYDYIIKTDVVPYGRVGLLPQQLVIFLRDITGFKNGDFVRIGVTPQTSFNSCFHAILTALQYEPYLQNKESAENIREHLLFESEPNKFIYSQELYDEYNFLIENNDRMSNWRNKLKETLIGENLPIDTSIHIRGLEKMFNINLFIFKSTSAMDEVETKTEGFIPEIPRHCLFYSQRIPDPLLATVLLVRFDKTDSLTGVKNIIYEPIIYRGELEEEGVNNWDKFMVSYERLRKVTGKSIYSYSDRMCNSLYNLFNQTYKTVCVKNECAKDKYDPVDIFKSLSSFTIDGIYIDEFGKMNGVKSGSTVVKFEPVAPIDSPIMFDNGLINSTNWKRFKKTSNTIYVAQYNNTRITQHVNVLQQFEQNKQCASLLAQFMLWLLTINRANNALSKKQETYDEWFDSVVESDVFNDKLLPPKYLPSVLFPQKLSIKSLYPYWSEVFNSTKTKLVLPSKICKTRLYNLFKFINSITSEIENVLPNPFDIVPKNIYHSVQLTKLSNIATFTNFYQLNSWLYYNNNSLVKFIEERNSSNLNPTSLFQNKVDGFELTDDDGGYGLLVKDVMSQETEEEGDNIYIVDKSRNIVRIGENNPNNKNKLVLTPNKKLYIPVIITK